MGGYGLNWSDVSEGDCKLLPGVESPFTYGFAADRIIGDVGTKS